MNKLISRSPVQRFKQGRKIVLKAQLGGYMFGKMGGWNRSMGNTISDQESLNYLKEMGLDGQNALQIQQYINQQFGKNSVKEDNKWGMQSRAGLKALYDNWKMQQKPQTPASPIGNSVIESQRALEEIPQLSQDQLMFNNINSKTFNTPLPPRTIPYDRSMTRDIIKDITGNSAYNFTGDQRKALRQYLNGEQYNQEAIKAFGDLKQYDKYMKWRLQNGGVLPSRNIVERFKNGRKIMLKNIIKAEKGVSFKQAWNEARAKKQRYFNWTDAKGNIRMYNSKASGNDTEYESFIDNMNEMSALLPTDKTPKHLGWERNNPLSNELRGKDREFHKQGTESTLPDIIVNGIRKQKPKRQPNYQVVYNMPMGTIEYVGRDGKQYHMWQDHSTGQYYYSERNKPVRSIKNLVPEGYIIPGANIAINKNANIGKIGLGLKKKWF